MPLVSFGKNKEELWFFESLYKDSAYGFKVNRVVADEQSPFQKIQIFETDRFGVVLVLDGIVQTSSNLEMSAPYGEMLAHVPLMTHPNPQKVLIIGGGDYEIAREVLKHPSVKRVDLVDIDKRVGELTLQFMPEFTGGAEKDSRLYVLPEDGAEFVKKAKNESYDAVLIDSTDPGGPSMPLFNARFIRNVRRILKPGGVIARQVGSLQFQPDEAPSNFRCIQSVFGEARLYLSSVPIYFGGLFGFVVANKSRSRLPVIDTYQSFSERQVETLYYGHEVHRAAFMLPPYVKNRLETVYGWKLYLEVEGCDLDVTDSREKCEEFIKQLCKKIDMKPFGPFQYHDFGHAKSKTSGPSIVQLIETSSIVAHISNWWDGTMFIDIWTCKEFDPSVAIDFTREFFGARVAFGTFHECGSARNSREKKVHHLKDFVSERKE